MANVVIWGITAATGITLGATATALVHIGVAVASTALSVAIANKNGRPQQSGGVVTESTTAGDEIPQSFVLGRYMTAGNLAAPVMSHGVSGDTRYLTYVIDLGDIAYESLESVIINGEACTLATGSPSTLTMSDGDGTTAAINSVFGATIATPNKYTGFAWVRFYDGTQTAADADLVSIYGSYPERPWSSDMIGRGVPYAICTFLLRDTPQIWTGQPEIKFVVKGAKLYDPRKDTTAGGSGAHRYGTTSTHEWTDNPAVMIYNIARGVQFLGGKTYGGGYGAADLPYTNWAAAMNACDVLISGRKTYIAGYEVRMATADAGGQVPLDVMDELLKACSGEVADVGGQLTIRVGGPAMPVKFITDEDILRSQPQDLDPFPGLEGSYNGVSGTFPNPNELWATKEAPPRNDTDAQAEDGVRLIADVTFPAVPQKTQVQQLMRAFLKDERRHRRHNISLPPEGVLLTPLDVIDWTSTRNGYTGKDFEISQIGIDPRTLSTTLSMREKNSGDYAWVVGDEIATDAPSAVKVRGAAQNVPGFAVAGISIRDGAGRNRRPAIRISWTAVQPGVTGVKYQLRERDTGDIVANGTQRDEDLGYVIVKGGIIPGEVYEARAKLRNQKSANWTAWTTVTAPTVRLITDDIDDDAIEPRHVNVRSVTNLVVNPRLEKANLRGWGVNSEWTISTQLPFRGTRCLRLIATGAGSTEATYNDFIFDADEGEDFFISCRIRHNGTFSGTSAGIRIKWMDEDGTQISISSATLVPTTTYQIASGTVTAPAGAAYGQVGAQASGVTSVQLHYDNFFCERKVNRDSIKAGAVTELYQDIFAGPTALTTTNTEYLAQSLPAKVQGQIFKRAVNFEARAPSGRTVTVILETRRKDFSGDPWTSWITIETWTITDTAWVIYRDTGNLTGPFDAFAYRLRASIDSASGTTALREACLTVDETTR